jgi:hypothetical protein
MGKEHFNELPKDGKHIFYVEDDTWHVFFAGDQKTGYSSILARKSVSGDIKSLMLSFLKDYVKAYAPGRRIYLFI